MKNLIKNIICFLSFHSRILHLYIRLALRKKNNLPVIILVYHRITEDVSKEINGNLTINHPLENFSKELEFLKDYFSIVPLEKAVEILKNQDVITGPTLAVTFDDGFQDNYRLAFPILKKLDIPATIFLASGFIGSEELPWVEKIGECLLFTQEKRLQLNSFFRNQTFNLETLEDKRKAFDKITSQLKEINNSERLNLINEVILRTGESENSNKRMLNWQEVKEMARNNITFGAHTMTHPILSKMLIDLAKKEINDSKMIIEEKTGAAVRHFAFPNGREEDFNEELKKYCQKIGFESVSSAIYGNNRIGNTDVFALKRLSPGKNIPVFAVDLIRAFLNKS